MKYISKFFNFLFLKIQAYDHLKRKEIRSISFFLSLFLTAIEFYKFNVVWNSKVFISSSCAMIFSIFIMLYPCLYFFRFKFKRFLSDHIFFSMSLLLYFTVLIPILGIFNDQFLAGSLDEIVIKILHIITVFVTMFLILLIVSRQFIMLIYKKKKIAGVDIITTFLTYIILGISFGSFYYIANLMAFSNMFDGVEKPSNFIFSNYLNYVYISLGSLTTVGTGPITAINPYIRLISVCETILGIFLTSFSLGFIFSVLGSSPSTTETPTSTTDGNSDNTSTNTNIFSDNIFIVFYHYVKNSLILLKTDLNNIENN